MATARRRAQSSKTIPVPLDFSRGMWSGGEAVSIPRGFARELRNYILRDGVWIKRPQFTYDGVSAAGAALWFDDNGGGYRLFVLENDPPVGTGDVLVKDISGESYTNYTKTTTTERGIVDYTNLRGTLFYLRRPDDDGVERNSIHYWDGVADGYYSEWPGPHYSPLYNIGADCITGSNGRLFLGAAVFDVFNYLTLLSSGPPAYGQARVYDPTAWTLGAVAASSTTIGAATLRSITPANTTGDEISLTPVVPPGMGGWGGHKLMWRIELRNTSQTYEVPMTAEVKYKLTWLANTPYAVGDIVTSVGSNGKLFKCTTAGTSGGAEPAWSLTEATTTADNTVTWTSIGTDVIASLPFYVPTRSADRWNQFNVSFEVPDSPTATLGELIKLTLKFGNAATPTIVRTTLDFGFRDGLANDSPRKANHGQQLTETDFDYPFANQEDESYSSARYATHHRRDYLYYTEPLDTDRISAANYFHVATPTGPITAVIEFNDDLYVFKRNAYQVFAFTDDFRIPILPKGFPRMGIGVLNPKALATGPDGALYGVGENFAWRMEPGGVPVDICTDAIRTEMMSKSADTWCEAQATPADRALCTVDHKNKVAHFYTQKGRTHLFNMEPPAWSVENSGGTADDNTGYEICDMAYSPNTENVYKAFVTSATGVAGLSRLDESVAGDYDQISDSGTLPIFATATPRPVQLTAPSYDLVADDAWLYYAATASQAGQPASIYCSLDQGATWTLAVGPFELPLTASIATFDYVKADIYKSDGSVMLRFVHEGKGQKENLSVSRLVVNARLIRGQYPQRLAVA